MGWTRFDDEYPRHPKIQQIAPAVRADAIALELAALCYCARLLTDGFISRAVVSSLALEIGFQRYKNGRESVDLRRVQRAVSALESVQRWIPQSSSGWVIHDYDQYQPTASEVKEKRRKEAEKKRNQRAQARLSLGMSLGDSAGESPGVSHGDASRARASGAGARARPIPIPRTTSPPDPPEGGSSKMSRKALRRYTGCRAVRGSHGSSYVRDPLGTDRPPADWPHEAPTAAEVKTALAEANGAEIVKNDPERYVRTAGFALQPDELEQILDLYVPDETERIRLADLAADLRSEQVSA